MGCGPSKDVRARPAATWDGHVAAAPRWSVTPAISTAHLERLRREFWETRIEGNRDMWNALRAAAEADSDELRDELFKAAGLRPANKHRNMTTCYDERGALYDVPVYALRSPENLDEEPLCPEFKDAAYAVNNMLEANRRRS